MKNIFVLIFFIFNLESFAQATSLLSRVPDGTKQILEVAATKSSVSIAQRWRKIDQNWEKVGNKISVVVGRAGTIRAEFKKEGDGHTPEGIYPFESIFGRQPQTIFQLPYIALDPEDKWIDDPLDKDYNRWIRGPTSAKSFERLWRSDELYDDFAVVGFNRNPVVPGKGSAIFMHIWRGPKKGTAGCVAMKKEDLIEVLSWLRPENKPQIVIGSRE